MRLVIILLLVSLPTYQAFSQLSDEYKTYLERSISENPQLLIDELSAKPTTLEQNLLIGELYFYAGNNQTASALIDKALLVLEESNKKETALYARGLNAKGLILWNDGKDEKALEYLNRALSINQQIKSGNQIIADVYNNLGLVTKSRSLDLATDFYLKALELLEKEDIKNDSKIAMLNINLALVESENSFYESAQKRLNILLKSWNASYEQDLPIEAFILSNLALIYQRTDQVALARSLFTESLDIYKRFYGTRNAELANTYSFLAELEREQGNFKKALEYVQNALEANTISFKNEDTFSNPAMEDVLKPAYQLSILSLKAQIFEDYYYGYSLKKQHLEAGLNCLKSADEVVNVIRRTTTNKKDQLALSKTAAKVYEAAQRITIALDDVTLFGNSYLQQAFYFSEKAKAATLLSAIAESGAKSFAKIPVELTEKETLLKNEIAFHSNLVATATSPGNLENSNNQLFEAKRNYELFINRLETDYPDYYNLKYNISPSSIGIIQAALTPNELLISYSFAPKNNQVYRYELTRTEFKVATIYALDDLERYLNAFRNLLTYRLQQPYQNIAYSLYNSLLPKKIHPSITKITVIPDATIGTIPFSALVTEKDENRNFKTYNFLIKQYDFSYNYSASLHALKPKAEESTSALLVAPVNFEYSAFNSLPATETEVNALQKILEGKQVHTDMFVGDVATESAFKMSNLPTYSYIHLATHGSVNHLNPELSAIYLAGNSSGNDDVLFTSEIYNLNLNAQLVCLSACETGLGRISRGEGIIGLGRAFSYAGAQNLLVSLWKVNDNSTSQLMQNFYENSLAENTYSHSLQQAQLKMIAEGFAEPYLWAPFVLWGK